MRRRPSRVLLPLLLLLLAAAPVRVCARAPAPAAQQRELTSREEGDAGRASAAVVPFANLITFMVQAPMLVFDLFWTRYVAVRGAAHAARNSLRALGAEADLADVSADVDAEAKAVGDLQGSMFADMLASNRVFVQTAARAALAGATDNEVCALAKGVDSASMTWSSAEREKAILDKVGSQREQEMWAEIENHRAQRDNSPPADLPDMEQGVAELVDAEAGIFANAILNADFLIDAKVDTDDVAELYKKREFIEFKKLLNGQECGCPQAPSPLHDLPPDATKCKGLREMLDSMLTREFAAVYKYFGHKGDAFSAQNQLVLLRNIGVMGNAEAKPQAQKDATALDSIKKNVVNGAALVAPKLQKDAPPPNAEASILGFLFFQKSARLGESASHLPPFYRALLINCARASRKKG
jgi:hypothetical protein